MQNLIPEPRRSRAAAAARGLAGLLALAIAACGSPTSDADAREVTPSGWYELRPENGVVLRMPNGWRASRAEEGKGPIYFSGPNGARVLALPVFLPSDRPQPPPEVVLNHFVRQFRPQLRWTAAAPVGGAATRMVGSDATQVALATFAYRSSPAGVAGYFYITEANAASYAALQTTFAGILSGLRVSGSGEKTPSNNARPPALRYVPWQDPTEGAFTTQVPAGWNVSGGVVRTSSLQLATPMRVIAPDEQIALFLSDQQLAGPAAFISPTQMMANTGFVEGTRYNMSRVSRYQTAAQFLPGYVATTFRANCQNIRVIFTDEFAELRQQLDSAAQAVSMPGTGARFDIGTVAFECTTPKGVMAGFAFARTRAMIMYGAPMGLPDDTITWDVDLLFGYIAQPQRVREAFAALSQVVGSWRVNPRWAGGNAEMAGAISRITADTTNYTNRILTEGYTQRALRGSEVIRIASNQILDTVDVIDPTTNREYKIDSTSNYYWINPQGTIVGTNISARPDIDYTEMVQLP